MCPEPVALILNVRVGVALVRTKTRELQVLAAAHAINHRRHKARNRTLGRTYCPSDDVDLDAPCFSVARSIPRTELPWWVTLIDRIDELCFLRFGEKILEELATWQIGVRRADPLLLSHQTSECVFRAVTIGA